MKPSVPVEGVVCPVCGSCEARLEARGPDFDFHSSGDQEFSMVVCGACGTYYLNPRPAVSALPQIYASDDYYSYDFDGQGNSVVLKARLQRNVRKARAVTSALGRSVERASVLDIGAGDGGLLEAFASCGYEPARLHGSELDEAAVGRIRAKGFQGHCVRAEEMSFDSGSLDVVTMMQVIEHVAAPRELLTSLHRMMSPGGVLCLETPNMNGWDRPFFRRRTWGGYHFPRHWTMWDPLSMRRMLDLCGFDVISISTLPAAVIWVWSWNHVLQDVFGNGPVARFFSMNNPLPMAVGWALDLAPALLGRASNMRVLARRRV
ncbi:MAG TPA: class I SAM-dependent methyltransferase [Chthoniobacterales bacterium]